MGNLTLVVLASILVEAVVDWVKELVEAEVRWPKILAAGVAVLLIFIMELDLFQMLGIETRIPHVGALLLAIVASRGANYTHDLLDRVSSWREAEAS